MAKLTQEQLDVLVAKRNKAGETAIVAIMNLEELKSYRENCVEAIGRQKARVAKCKKVGGVMQQIGVETMEVLEGYVAYIDAKVADAEAETVAEVEAPKGMAAIDAFIEAWKVRCADYYMNLKKKYNAVRYGKYEINKENLEVITDVWGNRKYTDERISEILNSELNRVELDSLKSKIAYGYRKQFERSLPKSDVAILEKMYGTEEQQRQVIMGIAERDGEKRKANLIARIEKKAGKIIDAFSLSMGANLEINGYIKGELKTVHVQTIYAGGYNIQELHFRVLVK